MSTYTTVPIESPEYIDDSPPVSKPGERLMCQLPFNPIRVVVIALVLELIIWQICMCIFFCHGPQ